MRILIVEDHADTAEFLSKLLGMLGHSGEVAGTMAAAAAAVAAAARSPAPFAVALVDLTLPDGSGQALMPLLAEKGIKGVAISGCDADVVGAAEAGFACHLTKPIDVGQLRSTLERLGGCGP